MSNPQNDTAPDPVDEAPSTAERGGLVVLGGTPELFELLDLARIRAASASSAAEAAAWLDVDGRTALAYGPMWFGYAMTGRAHRIAVDRPCPVMILLDRPPHEPERVDGHEVSDDPRALVWRAANALRATSIRDLSHPEARERLRRLVDEL